MKSPLNHLVYGLYLRDWRNVLREGLATDAELTGQNLKFAARELGLSITFNVVVSGADDNVNENINYFNAVNQRLYVQS